MSKNESQRASHKRSIIRMSTTVATFTDDTSLAQLETSKEMLDDYWTQFQAIQMAIELVTGPKEIDIQVVEMVDTERIYQQTKAKLRGFINRYAAADQNNQRNRQNQNDGNQRQQHHDQQDTSSKLPKLSLPEFDGTYIAWTSYKDQFTSMVKNQQNLANHRKLQYLKNSCKGEAEDIVSEYQTIDANFDPAWNALVERFENPRMIISSHLAVLFDQPIIATESAKSLRLLLRTTQKSLRSLNTLGGPVDHWDWMLIHLVLVRLDSKTRRYWELHHTSKQMATFDELVKALENRCNALETESSSAEVKVEPVSLKQTDQKKQSSKILHTSTSSNACPICNGVHLPSECKEFVAKNYQGRTELASKYSLCFKCLKPNHNFRSCSSKCSKCGRKHHVLMHNPAFDEKKANVSKPPLSAADSTTPNKNHILVSSSQSFIGSEISSPKSQILLSTAIIKIRTGYKNWVLARAFLDGGSQSCVITKRLVQLLNLRKTSCSVPITGIGEVCAGTVNKESSFEIMSCYDPSIRFEIKAVVMKSISTNLPNKRFDISDSDWSYLNGLQLADPKFNEPGGIDILIGAEHYLSLLLNEQKRHGPNGYPIAINTVFGWILSGAVTSTEAGNSSKIFSIVSDIDLDASLKNFWEIEEVSHTNVIKSLEDENCEKYFEETHYRNEEGRFVVRLPFVDNRKEIGDTKKMATRRFGYLERRFAREPELRVEYVAVMRELQALNHMAPADPIDGREHYYMPHHPIIKPSRTTTKVRVVMDATAKSSNGVSLNENLQVGPRLQQDLLRILLRFRSFRVAVGADIEKMFRQILVHQDDRRYQRILWRENPDEPIGEYELTTVTFGMSSAPFLAVKSLQELVKNPKVSVNAKLAILEDFYMDDLLTGGDDSHTVIDLIAKIQNTLEQAHFVLRKWISNDSDVLQSIDKSLRSYDNVGDIPVEESWKALGIHWHPSSDEFDYKLNENVKQLAITKRTILAVISSLYDPIGFLAPTIIVAKLFLQMLWTVKVDWDEKLDNELEQNWSSFQNSLIKLEEINIPRWIGSFSHSVLELHGFSDASKLAYSAVIYARTRNDDGSYKVNIVTGKSKVAPIKTLSQVKLELCGAVLLTRLIQYVRNSLRLDQIDVFTWCDNTAVLDWLQKPPSTWKTFVANRVSEIQRTLPSIEWRYVTSRENPADCASRGVQPSELKGHPLWWSGPSWLKLEKKHWPTFDRPTSSEADTEAKKTITLSHTLVVNDEMEILSTKFSSLFKLKTVTAYVIGFVDIARRKRQTMEKPPSVLDLDDALRFWLKFTQAKHFSSTLQRLKKGKKLKKNDPLLSLDPFLGADGLLRVGGRLKNSSLKEDQKHQIILPKMGSITKLVIEEIHKITFHGGTQLMLNYLRQKYWLLAGRRTINQLVKNCVKCSRVKGLTSHQMMGNLPAMRINVGRAFLKTGVDYAGPVVVKVPTINTRKYLTVKGYISVFVCLSTKAIHLELVSDQTAQAFLAALKRFTSRRGLCRELLSDNGSNFVGAKNELTRLFELLQNQIHNDTVKAMLAKDGIDWRMNPPDAPHFGGIYEAGVKSVKFHLRRSMDSTPFTFEEWTTMLCQIEAILNSRPLVPLSDDVNDLQPLTPGHFLIGEPLIAIPEPNLEHLKLNSLDRYQLMQRKVQEFWRRWSSEYLATLQQRTKWKSPVDNLKPGQIVTVKDDDLPPTKWLMGRILEVFPGKDSHVRVAKVQMANGELTLNEMNKLNSNGFYVKNVGKAKLKVTMGILERPIHKLCLLPVTDEN